MVEVLNQIANKCDGIRCDMAMLCLNETIQQTWGLYIQETEINNFTSSEFWTSAINRIKKIHPEFIFLAEVYWNLGVRLQQMGFNKRAC